MTCVNLESLIGSSLPMVVDHYLGDRELEIRANGSVFLGEDEIEDGLVISMEGPYGSKNSKAFDDAMERARTPAESEYKKIAKIMPVGSTVEMFRWRFLKNSDGEAFVSKVYS